MIASSTQPTVAVRAPLEDAALEILTPEARDFLARLAERFESSDRSLKQPTLLRADVGRCAGGTGELPGVDHDRST